VCKNSKTAQFVNVGMEYLVHESNTGRFKRVLIGQLDMDFPYTASKWCLS